MSVTQSVIAFALAAALLTITPGLDTALVLRTAAVEGPRRAMQAGIGICCGLLIWAVIAGLGLGALLAVSEMAYGALRIIGAGYLLYLGARMIARAGTSARTSEAEGSHPPGSASGGGWFVRGMLTNLLNPKVGVFYVTFLPQFIPAGVSVLGMSVLLASIHAMEGVAWFVVLVTATQPLGFWLRQPRVQAGLDRVTGGVLILFGAKLALAHRR
jgi:threonine/homoserine/homoserine lactone efflux protein